MVIVLLFIHPVVGVPLLLFSGVIFLVLVVFGIVGFVVVLFVFVIVVVGSLCEW